MPPSPDVVGPAIYKKIGFKNATNELRSLTLPGPTGGAYNMDRIRILEKVIKMLHGRSVLMGKTLTDLLWAMNCTKMRLAAGLRPDPLGEL